MISDHPEFVPEGFSHEMFKQRYTFVDTESWPQACIRIAVQMAKAERPEKVEKYTLLFYRILATNLFVPGGRIMYGSGRPNPALLNCFVLGCDDLDTKEGWGGILRENVITAMAGGGCGCDFSSIRPDGAEIIGQKGNCPGPISLMVAVNAAAKMTRAGGSRRAANMFSLDLDHPDVLKFLNCKNVTGDLDMANISLRSLKTTEFKNAVLKDLDWELSWKGKYKRVVSAKQLWERIVSSAWESAEPGFMNMELARKDSPSAYHSPLQTTNPCGEQFLPSYSNCCLGHLVLPRYIKEGGEVDWPLMGEVIRMGVRFLDNVIDVNSYPLPEQKSQAQKERRIGLGVTGLSDLLTKAGVRYGSEAGNKLTDKLFRFISKQAYEASILLAAEKGAFPACDPEKHVRTGFVKRMTPKIKSMIREHGIRNTALLSIAPTGTTSIISGNCSSGLEPMFAPAYYRNFWDGEERKKELCFHPLFREALDEGSSTKHFVPSSEITVEQHLEVQKIVQRHIDGAVSKTVVLPRDYPAQKLSKIWMDYLLDLKGTTFYREGSRNFVDDDGVEHDPPLVAIPVKEAIKLYKTQQSEIKEEAAHINDCASGTCEL